MPRAFLLLQLVPESSPFANSKTPATGIVDVRVPPEAQKEMEKAQEALANKKTADGIVHLQKALAIFPEFFDAQLLLGSTYMNEGRLGESDDVLSRAVKSNPKSVVAFVSLGELHRRRRKYDDAEKVLLEALRLEDESWVGHYTLGRVYWETNQIVKAGRQIGRAIQLEPDFAEAHLLGGNIFVRVGMAENAIVEYEEYLRLAPGGQQASQTRELVQKLRKSLSEKRLSPSKP
jgi:tetratricopeptide (TPR) repeat protein